MLQLLIFFMLNDIRREIKRDFTKSNKWINFKKKMTSKNEVELVKYIELLERQIMTLEQLINNHIVESGLVKDDGK